MSDQPPAKIAVSKLEDTLIGLRQQYPEVLLLPMSQEEYNNPLLGCAWMRLNIKHIRAEGALYDKADAVLREVRAMKQALRVTEADAVKARPLLHPSAGLYLEALKREQKRLRKIVATLNKNAVDSVLMDMEDEVTLEVTRRMGALAFESNEQVMKKMQRILNCH